MALLWLSCCVVGAVLCCAVVCNSWRITRLAVAVAAVAPIAVTRAAFTALAWLGGAGIGCFSISAVGSVGAIRCFACTSVLHVLRAVDSWLHCSAACVEVRSCYAAGVGCFASILRSFGAALGLTLAAAVVVFRCGDGVVASHLLRAAAVFATCFVTRRCAAAVCALEALITVAALCTLCTLVAFCTFAALSAFGTLTARWAVVFAWLTLVGVALVVAPCARFAIAIASLPAALAATACACRSWRGGRCGAGRNSSRTGRRR